MVESYLADVATLPRFTHRGCELPPNDGCTHRTSPTTSLGATPNMSRNARLQFWDGRADTLWVQATGPFEDASESGSKRLFVAHGIVAAYKAQYDAILPSSPFPALDDATRLHRTASRASPRGTRWTDDKAG